MKDRLNEGVHEQFENLTRVQTAAREAAKCILSVFETKEGSGRRRHIGSAFVVRPERRAALVTAAHVVSGASRKTVVMSNAGTIQNWPSPYAVLVPKANDVADADVAYMTGTLQHDEPDLAAFPLANVAVDAGVDPTMSFVAFGLPASRTRIVDGNKVLQPLTFTAVTRPVSAGRSRPWLLMSACTLR